VNALLRPLGFGLVALAASLGTVALWLGPDLSFVELVQPWWLLAALAPAIALAARGWARPRPATMKFSRTRSVQRIGRGWAASLAELPDGLRLAAACCLALAMARPQSSRMTESQKHEGIDIAVALDMSDSMQNDDMGVTRLVAAKDVIDQFIAKRSRDRVALVAFGANASTVTPLTLDHAIVRGLLARLELGVMDGTKTAIGAGLGMALNRLDESKAKSKVVVLLTDGVHNADGVDPDSAAQEAAARGVRVYTVLIGDITGARIDPAALERIASATEGFAYTAADTETLTTSFQDLLDKLERSEIESKSIRAELFHLALWPALLLLLDVLLRNTRLRRFP
jgi:Ca-activated chloride channel family protein